MQRFSCSELCMFVFVKARGLWKNVARYRNPWHPFSNVFSIKLGNSIQPFSTNNFPKKRCENLWCPCGYGLFGRAPTNVSIIVSCKCWVHAGPSWVLEPLAPWNDMINKFCRVIYTHVVQSHLLFACRHCEHSHHAFGPTALARCCNSAMALACQQGRTIKSAKARKENL